ncbi:MAG TPA: hypothetical protein VNJ01_01645 [Bacteriovoracaceae bacterium]|nr:hypothetical protein [Bacteriovoracaceae bacterium]
MLLAVFLLVPLAFSQVNRPIQRDHVPPIQKIDIVKIRNSPTRMGSVPAGVQLINVKTNRTHVLPQRMFVKFHELQDEFGFKYLLNKDGSCTYKAREILVEPITEELALYEPPLTYTPAPLNITRTEYDRKLTLHPEVSLYAGLVNGTYMRDLFNDSQAASGRSNQFGAHLFTDWDLPLKVGAAVHYETTTYQLSDEGSISYRSLSFGPQLRSKDFDLFADFPARVQTNFRVGPFSKATANSATNEITYNFNSADLMASIEHPIKNSWGEFVVGLYGQWQWLNLKDASDLVSIRATNKSNKSFGLSLSQVFQ